MDTIRLDVRQEVEGLYRDLRKILFFSGESKSIDFYISALTEYNSFNSTDDIQEWLRSLNEEQYFQVTRVPLGELRKWSFNNWTGDLEHESGGFFSIRGLRVKTNVGNVPEWSQPIIHQPEIGVLGIIAKKFNGILYLLIQAKAEPGNINTFQLSPTVQATRSNYMRLHGGKPTLYLEYFLDGSKAMTLVDQLQSEQGARFYHKRNRNIIVRVPDNHDIKLSPNHRWVTLGQLLKLAQKDDTVNMDIRSVLSGIDFAPEKITSLAQVDESALRDCLERSPIVPKPVHSFGIKLMVSCHPNNTSLHTMEDLVLKISHEKFNCELDTRLIPLNEIRGWKRTADELFHEKRLFFSVIGVRVEAANREVISWDQPIIRQENPGIVGFIIKEIDGKLHFLVQLKMESGVMDLMEIAPTVQCITGNYSVNALPPYVNEFIERKRMVSISDTYQSEEGGRFFQESNQNILLQAGDGFPLESLPRYMWMSFQQLKLLIKFNNFVNVEARSLIACMQMK